MTNSEFDALLVRRLALTKEVLASKAKEYATHDRLHNFKAAARLTGQTPQETLLGMLVKHWVSIMDLVAAGNGCHSVVVDDKIGDAINYLILLEAILSEAREKAMPSG